MRRSVKLSELPKLSRLPEGEETLLPVVIKSDKGYNATYKVSIADIVKAIEDRVDEGFNVEMEHTENGIIFRNRWPEC